MKEQINLAKIPEHVAIIMDGNGRWAQQQAKERLFGHQNGIRPIKIVMEACKELSIKYLTLYAFSTENWKRPQEEVLGLWKLLGQALTNEMHTLQQNNIRLNIIGHAEALDEATKQILLTCLNATKNNDAFILTLAINYGGRNEITTAARNLAIQAIDGKIKPEEITESVFSHALMTSILPDPDLIIRTGGELRISNFLLWQAAYAELYFTHTLWPDFDQQAFYKAIIDFQNRERRLGMVSGQQYNQ